MRIQFQYRTASRENYQRFVLEHPEYEHISFKEWKEIIYKFSETVINHILNTGDKVKLPYGLGCLSINKKMCKKTKEYQGKTYMNMPINWQATKKEGKYIYHMNYHTDGFRYGWLWFKDSCRFYQSELWYFKATREASRAITKYLKSDDHYKQLYNQWLI